MTANAHAPVESRERARLRVRVRGLVQGVGFRPFVYGLANQYALSGWVLARVLARGQAVVCAHTLEPGRN